MYLQQSKLEEYIPDLAQKVESISGLKVPLDNLKFKVINGLPARSIDELLEEAAIVLNKDVKKIIDYIGPLPKMVFEHSLATYSSLSAEIRLFSANLPPMPENAIKMIIGHELAHHAQFSIAPFKRLADLAQAYSILAYFKPHFKFDEPEEADRYISTFGKVQRLVEGDAAWVQQRLADHYPLEGFLRISYPTKLSIKHRIGAITDNPLQHYHLGKKRVDAIYKKEGRSAINKLYHSADLDEICNCFDDAKIERSLPCIDRNLRSALIKAKGFFEPLERCFYLAKMIRSSFKAIKEA
ncbi:MAG: hypothetical protein AABX05_04075 [Nanoarchaeota archaeon]